MVNMMSKRVKCLFVLLFFFHFELNYKLSGLGTLVFHSVKVVLQSSCFVFRTYSSNHTNSLAGQLTGP